MNVIDVRKAIQGYLGVTQDGNMGAGTRTAFNQLAVAPAGDPWPPQDPAVHMVIASSFADPRDLAAYNKAIAEGMTQQEAFAVGDNCIGCWGDFTGDPDKPMFALPPEDWLANWKTGANARGKRASVIYNCIRVVGELRDTMPHKDNIRNGASIDLNPGFAKAFGLEPGFMLHGVTWEWVD